MENDFQAENRRLKASWDRFDAEYLDAYLVSGVEDPRINCQSIVTRALIADSIWPGEFTALINEELRFGAVLTWLVSELEGGADRSALRSSIIEEGTCPRTVHETYEALESDDCPLPNYLSLALDYADVGGSAPALPVEVLDLFCDLWKSALAGREVERISVLEPACGSANDYRIISRCGLSKFIDYAGFDISGKNVANAKRRFPGADFFVASILSSGIRDRACDYLFVHDLFEHLSREGIDRALREVVRITRREAWLHFFNAADREDHLVHPVGSYYWNLLSTGRLVETLEELDATVDVIAVPQLLDEKFGFDRYYNLEAVTLMVSKTGQGH